MLKLWGNFSFNWKLSLFTLLLLPVLLKLGFWQLAREDEKIALQKIYTQRQSAATVNISALNRDEDLQYKRIQLAGSFDNEHSFLLDNKINSGQVGFEVLSPFYTNSGELIFINRGWGPQGQYRGDYPAIERVLNNVLLNGTVYVPLGQQVLLGEDEKSSSWPRLIQSLGINQMAEAIQQDLKGDLQGEFEVFPYSVRLEESMPGVMVRNWPVISTSPEKHRGYAVQWFTMALVLIGLYLYTSYKPATD